MDKKDKVWEDFVEDVKPLKKGNNRFFKKPNIEKKKSKNF